MSEQDKTEQAYNAVHGASKVEDAKAFSDAFEADPRPFGEFETLLDDVLGRARSAA